MKAGQFYKVAELSVGSHGVTLHENINGVIFNVKADDVTDIGVEIRILNVTWFFTFETLNDFIELPEIDMMRTRGRPGIGITTYYMVYPAYDGPSQILKKARTILENRVEKLQRNLVRAKEMAAHDLKLNSTYRCVEAQ